MNMNDIKNFFDLDCSGWTAEEWFTVGSLVALGSATIYTGVNFVYHVGSGIIHGANIVLKFCSDRKYDPQRIIHRVTSCCKGPIFPPKALLPKANNTNTDLVIQNTRFYIASQSAARMLKEGFSAHQIHSWTGLTLEEIDKLSNHSSIIQLDEYEKKKQ